MNKSLAFLLTVSLLASQIRCDDDELKNPNYPIEPFIEFKHIEFIETPIEIPEYETILFTIKYRDGDSDLGLHNEEFEYPFYDKNYFLEDGSGDTVKIIEELKTIGCCYDYLSINPESTNQGKLVTDRTRQKNNYGYLPEYNPNHCADYAYREILVSEESQIIDGSYNIYDTLIDENNKKFIRIQEALLYQQNENHYNIFVEFYVSDDGITFTELDWFEEYCINYNGRFPFIGDQTGTILSGTLNGIWIPFKVNAKTPWEGEISCKLFNYYFSGIFLNKILKLKIHIKDRNLNSSNVIETPSFTLDEIRND